MRTALLFCFSLLASFLGRAQDVQIPLEEFTLQVPQVNQLVLRPVGAPFLEKHPADSTQRMLMQPIYYELRRKDGRAAEEGNKAIPIELYALIYKYITKTITAQEVGFINQFFQYADWPITAKMPEE